MKYDLVVVGAGPAGLVAAKTAAENGLDVAIMDRKKDIPKTYRACTGMLCSLNDPLYGETYDLVDGKIVYRNAGFAIDYGGPHYDFYSQSYCSPGGYCVTLGDPVKKEVRIGAAISKEHLLRALLGANEKLGVNVLLSAAALDVVGNGGEAAVKAKMGAETTFIESKMVIAADGVNSRLASKLGLNRDRSWWGFARGLMYCLRDVEPSHKHTVYIFLGRETSPRYGFNALVPGYDGETFYLTIGEIRGKALGDLKKILDSFMRKSVFAKWFESSKVIGKPIGSTITTWSPARHPFVGKTLFIGDAAYSVETLNQGAMLCGYHAGRVAAKAIKNDNVTDEGLKEYLDWWANNMLAERHESYAKGGYLPSYFTDEELDYLFKLGQPHIMRGCLNPYVAGSLLRGAIQKSADVLIRERPELVKKLQAYSVIPLEDLRPEKLMRVKVTVDKDKCSGCGGCIDECPVGAISLTNGAIEIDELECIDCGRCLRACPSKALRIEREA